MPVTSSLRCYVARTIVEIAVLPHKHLTPFSPGCKMWPSDHVTARSFPVLKDAKRDFFQPARR
jgi:hypothetical protein